MCKIGTKSSFFLNREHDTGTFEERVKNGLAERTKRMLKRKNKELSLSMEQEHAVFASELQAKVETYIKEMRKNSSTMLEESMSKVSLKEAEKVFKNIVQSIHREAPFVLSINALSLIKQVTFRFSFHIFNYNIYVCTCIVFWWKNSWQN